MNEVSVVLTAHREAELAGRALQSIYRAAKQVSDANLEVLIVLDRADLPTEQAVQSAIASQPDGFTTYILKVDFGDAGQSRAAGVQAARWAWIAFLDADDLWGESWLKESFAHINELKDHRCVLHPQQSLFFGKSAEIWQHPDSRDSDFEPLLLLERNPWTALCLAPRELLMTQPQQSAATDTGFGYEDWHWHLETLAAGISHQCVKHTTHFIRRRSQSRGAEHRKVHALLRPSSFFKLASVRESNSMHKPVAIGIFERAEIFFRQRAWAKSKLEKINAILAGLLYRAIRLQKSADMQDLSAETLSEAQKLTDLEPALANLPKSLPSKDFKGFERPQLIHSFTHWIASVEGRVGIGDSHFLRASLFDVALELKQRGGIYFWQENLPADERSLFFLAQALIQTQVKEVVMQKSPVTQRLLCLFAKSFSVSNAIFKIEEH